MLGLADLRCVFGATLVSNLGDGIVAIALVWAVLDLTHSATKLGIVLAARVIAQIAVILLAGVVADRISRRRMMIGADLVRLVGQALIGVALVTHHADLVELVLSQIVLGAASAAFQPASNGLLGMVAGEHIQEANAMRSIAQAGSMILGPVLGALIVVAVGGPWGIICDSVSYGASAFCLARLSPGVGDALVPADERASMLGDLRAGFRELVSRTWVWSLIVAFAFANAVNATWDVLAPLATRHWYDGAPAFALLSISWSVGSLLAGVLMLRYKPRRPLFFGVLICCPCVLPGLLLAFRWPLAIIAPLQMLGGVGAIAFGTLWWTALQTHVPPEAISRVVSYDYAGSYLLMPLGMALGGPLSAAVGLEAALIITSLISLAVMAMTLLVREVRELSAPPPAADIVTA